MTNCSVCLGKHDDATHDATLRVRAWFRDTVLMGIAPVKKAAPVKDKSGWGTTGKSNV